MTPQGAERAITTSALIVAGVYIYRRLTEGSGTVSSSKVAQLLGQGSPPSVGTFVTAWGTAYLVMAIMAQASPGLGGGFAILAAVGDVLSNGRQIAADINTKVTAAPAGVGRPTSPATRATSVLLTPGNLHWVPQAAASLAPAS